MAAASAATRELDVGVTGEQFAWTFTYPREITGGKPLSTTELYLPINRSVEFRIHAKDVLHDFWVPAFRMKMDAVPGITTHYRITPDKLGTFPVVCAELCGLGHATMRSAVLIWPTRISTLAKSSMPIFSLAVGAAAAAPEAGAVAV